MQPDTARVVVFAAPGKIDIETVPVHDQEGILVRSELIGISHGTEMLFYRGTLPEGIETDDTLSALAGELSYPIKYGYMNAGMTGKGERVFAFYPHQDVFIAKASELIHLPDGVPAADAVFLASMETAVSIVQDLNPVAGETLLVIGQGTVGLLVAEILTLGDLFTVFTTDCHALRREASSAIGCTSLDPDDGGAAEAIMKETGGRGVDRAVNVSASGAGLQFAVDLLAFEGEVLEASWYGSRDTRLSLGTAFHRKRLAIRSTQVSHIGGVLAPRWSKPRRLEYAVGLLEKIRPSKYITHTFPFEEAAAAFEHLDKRPGETIQVVLKP